MIHPTRTNLLLLREKAQSVNNSVGILKARRQALIREFLSTTVPFLRSREDIRKAFGKAMGELALSLGNEGKESVESISHVTKRDMGVEITEKSIWGLKFRDVIMHDSPVRNPGERGYDYLSTTPHLEECCNLFEKIVESMIEIAAFESKLKRLGEEILKTTRRIRVLEERILPDLRQQIRTIAQYIGERERETYYRLKRFKEITHRGERRGGK
ncbi:MAG TPA: V-type ATP synthase subunit D [Thermodesulfovibrionales bacterium]|nr:V-type ATP synthase subunit D [Thermodesulfovibrionales bacterium]